MSIISKLKLMPQQTTSGLISFGAQKLLLELFKKVQQLMFQLI